MSRQSINQEITEGLISSGGARYVTAVTQPQLISTSLEDAYDEVVDLAFSIVEHGWREKEPDSLEVALGFTAFFYWLVAGALICEDPYFFLAPSYSARKVSESLIFLCTHDRELSEFLAQRKPSFQPTFELDLSHRKPASDDHNWRNCTTRFVILLSRNLAFAVYPQDSGKEFIAGSYMDLKLAPLKHVDISNHFMCLTLARQLLTDACGIEISECLLSQNRIKAITAE